MGEASRESIEVRALVFHRDDTDCALATMVYQYQPTDESATFTAAVSI